MKLIVAVDADGGIGKDGSIPWRCKEDLKFFKFVTMGHDVFMGRKTQDSLVSPLKGRRNFVITSDQDRVLPGFSWCDPDGIALGDGFVIGGSSIYELALSKLDMNTGSRLITEIIISRISGRYKCDRFFNIPDTYNKIAEIRLYSSPYVTKETVLIERWI